MDFSTVASVETIPWTTHGPQGSQNAEISEKKSINTVELDNEMSSNEEIKNLGLNQQFCKQETVKTLESWS